MEEMQAEITRKFNKSIFFNKIASTNRVQLYPCFKKR